MKIAIIGAGMGGLVTAVRLAALGHSVTLFERNDVVGGKVRTIRTDGFSFDLGPTLLTMPHLYDEVLRLAGSSLDAEAEIVAVDPQFSYRWPDGSQLQPVADEKAWLAALDEFASGSSRGWQRFARSAATIWDIATRTFLSGPLDASIGQRANSPLDLVRIDGVRSLHALARSHFDDPRLVQMIGRYATYTGSSPFKAPATLACISHIERTFGTWHVIGGFARLAEALAEGFQSLGGRIELNADVDRVVTDSGRAEAIEIGGILHRADAVISNADAASMLGYGSDRRSHSAAVVCLAVRGRTAGIAHHNVWFSGDDRREFDAVGAGMIPDDPTIYGCVSSVTDVTMAPAGDENWYLLTTMPPSAEVEAEQFADRLLARLADRGVVLRGRAKVVATVTPADMATRFRSLDGAIYGRSSQGLRAAFSRPANRSSTNGLFLVGGSAHPGGGLPLVAMGAHIVAEMIGPA